MNEFFVIGLTETSRRLDFVGNLATPFFHCESPAAAAWITPPSAWPKIPRRFRLALRLRPAHMQSGLYIFQVSNFCRCRLRCCAAAAPRLWIHGFSMRIQTVTRLPSDDTSASFWHEVFRPVIIITLLPEKPVRFTEVLRSSLMTKSQSVLWNMASITVLFKCITNRLKLFHHFLFIYLFLLTVLHRNRASTL